eukprot:Gregarina_sp_Poly_1__1732@NODE_1446_length_4130_cov_51_014029_g958_i0_p2_GENE_NODE_1446_length_4130_cov_51_014029_g958_i0NODE_1446_length_4130_cov_51_014029_g958_i0_p2_ORF_typecomplete_len351_score31_72DA1like/PF12315_8/3_5e09Peptidase_M78/PF06114_13/0_0045SprTlike/PF10263_9/0_2_NODE_1446_length_4130_cov_51_014029_g958_i015352587
MPVAPSSVFSYQNPGEEDQKQTWCDLCGKQLPRIKDLNEEVFYDCYVHPYWKQQQILCPYCACSDVECCITCEFKIAVEDLPRCKFTSEGYMCEYCAVSAPVVQFKEAYMIKQHTIQRMVSLFALDSDIKLALSRLPVRLKSKTRHVLQLANHMDCDTWNEFRSLFGFCAFEKFDPEQVLIKEIVILKGLPRIIFSKVLAHELFHALMALKKGLILNFPPAQRFVLRLASEGHYRDFCDSPETYRDLEEGACHLFAGELLTKSKTYSEHEARLKELWTYKILPCNKGPEIDNARQSGPLALAIIPLWNDICVRKLGGSQLPDSSAHDEIRRDVWKHMVQELATLKCVWSF